MGAWGLGLFQSDQDLDMVSDLGGEAGLHNLREEAQKRAQARRQDSPKDGADGKEKDEKVFLDLYAPQCDDIELVRKHLDSGALAGLIAKKQAEAQKKGAELTFWDPRYQLMLIGACAMSLGCTLPPSFKDYLKSHYQSAGLMRDAKKQMEKALNGPDGFKDGEPYEFDSPGLMETMMSGGPPEEDRMYPHRPGAPFKMLNVQSPFGMPPLSDEVLQNIRDRAQEGKLGESKCGGCGASAGKGDATLQACGGCKTRKYCGKDCQKAHWKIHKKVCKELAKEKEEKEKENL